MDDRGRCLASSDRDVSDSLPLLRAGGPGDRTFAGGSGCDVVRRSLLLDRSSCPLRGRARQPVVPLPGSGTDAPVFFSDPFFSLLSDLRFSSFASRARKLQWPVPHSAPRPHPQIREGIVDLRTPDLKRFPRSRGDRMGYGPPWWEVSETGVGSYHRPCLGPSSRDTARAGVG